jgi:L-amino acid N-acyltransferase YncA
MAARRAGRSTARRRAERQQRHQCAPQAPDGGEAGGAADASIDLPAGGTLRVRTATAADVDALGDLYRSLSVEDRQYRFFTASHPQRDTLERFVRANECGGLWLVVVSDDNQVVADAGYAPLPNGDAEFAVTVAKVWRGWLGPYLLDVLAREAAAHGIPNLRAEILRENRRMLAVVQRRGYATVAQGDGTIASVTLATSGGPPGWPPVHDRPRLLIEGCGGRWRAEDEACRMGWAVITCGGPTSPSVPHCPVLNGAPCPLVEGSDLVILALPAAHSRREELLEAHHTVSSRNPPEDSRLTSDERLSLLRDAARTFRGGVHNADRLDATASGTFVSGAGDVATECLSR